MTEASARVVAVAGIIAIALIHILDAGATYTSTRYIFWLYMALVAACVPITTMLVQWRSARVWVFTTALAAGPFVAYLLSRSVGLPGDGADVGNWLDTLGMVSLFVEATVITLSLTRLLHLLRADAGATHGSQAWYRSSVREPATRSREGLSAPSVLVD
jgi:hypothetical protein